MVTLGLGLLLLGLGLALIGGFFGALAALGGLGLLSVLALLAGLLDCLQFFFLLALCPLDRSLSALLFAALALLGLLVGKRRSLTLPLAFELAIGLGDLALKTLLATLGLALEERADHRQRGETGDRRCLLEWR